MAKKNEKRIPTKTGSNSFFQKRRWEIIIFIFSILLYANSIPNEYNMDDELVTIQHRLTSKGVSAIPEIITSTYYKDAAGYAYEYRPVVLITFAVEHQLFGDNAHVSHFFNVLLYGLCCILLFRVLLLLTAGFSFFVPLAITILFVAHPAHTEVVSSIKNRDEILGLIFSLFTFLAALKMVNKGYVWLIPIPFLFLTALLSKMSMLPFAIIIPAGIIFFTRIDFKKTFYISLLLLLASFFAINDILYEKLSLMLSLFFPVIALFALTRIQYIVSKLKQLYLYIGQNLKHFFSASIQTINTETSDDFLKTISIDFKTLFHIKPMLASLFASGIFLSGVFYSYHPFIVIGAAAFILFILAGNELIKWWASVLLYICLGLSLLKGDAEMNVYSDLLFISLAYHILFGNRKMFIPLTILYISLLLIASTHSALGVGILMLLTYRWKKTRVLTLLFFLGGIYGSCRAIIHDGIFNLSNHNYGVFLAAILIVFHWFKKGPEILTIGYRIIAIIALFFFFTFSAPLSTNNVVVKAKSEITSLGQRVNTNIITEKQSRPLNFIEQPLDFNTPAKVRIGTAFEILFEYLHKVILPYPMAFYYGYKFIVPQSISDPAPMASLIIHLLLGIAFIYFINKDRNISFALLIYLISIAAVSGYLFPIPGQLGERFLFIPSLGWCILIVIIFTKLFKVKRDVQSFRITDLPKGFQYALGAVLICYSSLTFARNFNWKDYVTLMEHDINYVQNSAQAHNLLALNLMKKSYETQDPAVQLQERTEALGHFKKAVEIYPDFYNANYDVARVYSMLNQPDSTVAYFKRALAIDSTNTNPALISAEVLLQQNKTVEAIPLLEYVVRHRRDTYEPYDKLSFAYFKIGDYKKSIAVNDSAIVRLSPQPAPYVNISHVYASLNQNDSASLYLQKALQFAPNDPSINQMLQQLPAKK